MTRPIAPNFRVQRSSPYYIFGAERRYPYAWHGGPGGVPQSRVAAETRELGIFDLAESGLLDPELKPFPAFRRTNLHAASMGAIGDWPLLRPAGPEPLNPNNLADIIEGVDDKKLGLAIVVGAAAWWLLKKRKNPSRRRITHVVKIGNATAMSFTSAGAAKDYAAILRREGKPARVVRKR